MSSGTVLLLGGMSNMAEYNGRYIPEHIRLDLPRVKKQSGGNKGNNRAILVREDGRENWIGYGTIKDFLMDTGIDQTTYHAKKGIAKKKGLETMHLYGWEIKFA